MSTVGQREKKTQQRVVKLFRDTLGYRYLGNWEEREGVDGKGNRNIEPDLLRAWLKRQTEPTPYRAVSELTIEQVLELVKNQDEY